MEQFTSIEFNEKELHRIEDVKATLLKEGWKVLTCCEQYVEKGSKRVLVAVKYKWVRTL